MKAANQFDMWRARDLTLFGGVMILKSLGLSQLIYLSAILNIPEGFADLVKTKLFKFLWKNKRYRINYKRSGLYKDLEKGGLRMIDIEIMFKALKLQWWTKFLGTLE